MRKLVGLVFLLASVALAYLFAANALRAGELPAAPFFAIPFRALGKAYPLDVLFLAGAVLTLGLSLFFLILGGRPAEVMTGPAGRLQTLPKRWGAMTVLFLLSGLLALACFWISYVGAAAEADPRLVGLFAALAGGELIAGALLGFFALLERLKSIVLFLAGLAVYAGGLTVLGLFILWGK